MKFSQVIFVLSFSGVFAYPIAQSDVRTVDTEAAAVEGTNTVLNIETRATAKVSASSVQGAVSNFANDANTVSSSLNQLATTTDKNTIKSLATTAFAAESNEDQQRSVLASAAGSAGATSNAKIVQNTPTVLTGLKNIMNNPTVANTKSNLATIQAARNPNILPSITQLSNAALKAMGLTQNAQKFAATGQ